MKNSNFEIGGYSGDYSGRYGGGYSGYRGDYGEGYREDHRGRYREEYKGVTRGRGNDKEGFRNRFTWDFSFKRWIQRSMRIRITIKWQTS